jgi:hypothetical protein
MINIFETIEGLYVSKLVGAFIRYLYFNTINIVMGRNIIEFKKFIRESKKSKNSNSLVNAIVGGPLILIIILIVYWLYNNALMFL